MKQAYFQTYQGTTFTLYWNKSNSPNILYFHVIIPAGVDNTTSDSFVKHIQKELDKRGYNVHMRIYSDKDCVFWANRWRL